MTRIDELLVELCPNGVPFRPLGDIAELQRGTSITKGLIEDGDIPVIAGGQSPAYHHGKSNRDGETIVIAGSGAYAGYVSYWNESIFVSDAFTVKPNVNIVLTKYVFYFLKNKQSWLHDLQRGGGVPHVYAKDVVPLRVPTPPLEIQLEIVRILDAFTELEAELEAELEVRQSQYACYRDALLSFEERDDVRWSSLGDICNKVTSGGTPLATRTDYYDGDIPWLRTQEVRFADIHETEIQITSKALQESSAKWIPENCVIVAISGATAGRSAINKIPLTTNQHCCNLEIDPQQAKYRYVFYWVCSQYEKIKALGQGARSDLNVGIIKKFPIPIPSLQDQERIVNILDKFDTLVNDLSVGLPAELKARRQQYEHYRDRLLSFKEAA